MYKERHSIAQKNSMANVKRFALVKQRQLDK